MAADHCQRLEPCGAAAPTPAPCTVPRRELACVQCAASGPTSSSSWLIRLTEGPVPAEGAEAAGSAGGAAGSLAAAALAAAAAAAPLPPKAASGRGWAGVGK